MMNPYQTLAAEKFWKTGVSQLSPGAQFQKLWEPKFKITKESKILTVGSCFAQNISRWLIANGYCWLETELPPEGTSLENKVAQGYGVFSFRTGNIYTPALLRQWIEQSIEAIPIIDEVIHQNGKYFDPFRPQIPAGGYDTARALEIDRLRTLSAIREAISEADVFLFTLGLTEAWVNTKGYVYPMCPGTLKGEFDPAQHQFINYDYDQIMKDMTWIIETLKLLNAEIKFLLTISPVPLTATASEEHVLTATVHSKSILRSVAGKLKKDFLFVDYFPSYELISSVATRENFFEENLRSVQKRGVEYVMRHFAEGIGAPPPPGAKDSQKRFSSSEDACEDVVLETWNNNWYVQSEKSFRSEGSGDGQVCLVGCSQMGRLSKALQDLNFPHMGGIIMRGPAWENNQFVLDKDEIFVPLEGAPARQRWSQTLPFFKKSISNRVVLTNIGMQTLNSVMEMANFFMQKGITKIQISDFEEYFFAKHYLKIEIIRNFIALGCKVVVISDPPTRDINEDVRSKIKLWEFYEDQALAIFAKLGCNTLLSREFMADTFSDAYYSKIFWGQGREPNDRDWLHGSQKYYFDFARKLISLVLKSSEE